MDHLPELKRLSFVLPAESFRSVARGLIPGLDPGITPEAFRDLYRSTLCDAIHWPKALPLLSEDTIREGIVVKSISGKIEGRTTGSRRKCSATGCPGWFIGVLWETGQQMYPCSEGWHYFPDGDGHIEVIGGGEISARFVSPAPLGTPPAPRKEWPRRSELLSRKGWRVAP